MRAALALAAGLLAASPAPAAQLFAEPLSQANLQLRVGGPHALGGVGDWALGNGTLCAVVTALDHETVLSLQGGTLIDLGHCGAADDAFDLLQPLLNFSRQNVPPLSGIRAEVDADEARVVVEGGGGGIRFQTTYALGTADPHELRVTTRLTRTGPGERLALYGDVVLRGRDALRVFAARTDDPRSNLGFAHGDVRSDDPLSIVRGLRADDLQVLLSGDEPGPGIAYGLQAVGAWHESAGGQRVPVDRVSVSGRSFTLLGAFARPFWLGGGGPPGWLELAQAPLLDLGPGESFVYERRLVVGDRADVASVTDRLWPQAARVEGSVDDPAARIHVLGADGAPFSFVRPEPDGRFGVRLPEGTWTLRFVAPGGREVRRSVTLPGETRLGRIAVGAPARVTLPRGSPMRLVFVPADGAPDPRFGDDLMGMRWGKDGAPGALETRDVSLAGLPSDPRRVTVPPGRYRVLASRGPEYTVTEADLEARAGEDVRLAIRPPERAFETPGWISADLHVHSGRSDDSDLPLRRRLASFVAQGAEVLVATDHDQITDYRPLIARLGLGDEVASIPGAEITGSVHGGEVPYTNGHSNAFPLPYRPELYRSGAPRHEGRRLRSIVASVHALGGVLQLNHALRYGHNADLNYFSHLGVVGRPFDPTRPLDAPPNDALVERDPATGLRDLDFEALELLNGPDMPTYRALRADWFSLLLQGERRTGTANSDSHVLGEVVALPRDYVRVDHDTPDRFDPGEFVESVRAGRLTGTTGPWVDARLGGAGVGGLFRGRRGALVVEVRAAPWVPVTTARVYVNAALHGEFAIAAGDSLVVPLVFERDAFVVVEVSGPGDELFRALTTPDAIPFAFTNPIFVDADGNGAWTAPGLPEALPAAIQAAGAGGAVF